MKLRLTMENGTTYELDPTDETLDERLSELSAQEMQVFTGIMTLLAQNAARVVAAKREKEDNGNPFAKALDNLLKHNKPIDYGVLPYDGGGYHAPPAATGRNRALDYGFTPNNK